jgi:hypothetical protein
MGVSVLVRPAVDPSTGSYNFTGKAERDNDENLVIVAIRRWCAPTLTSSSACMHTAGAIVRTLPLDDSLLFGLL